MKKYVLTVILLVCLLTASFASAGQETLTIQVNSFNYDEAQTLLDLMNTDRTSGNAWILNSDGTRKELGKLPALTMDPDLTQMAMQRAAEQALSFGHTRPDGSEWNSLDSSIRAENVGGSFTNDPGNMYSMFLEEEEGYDDQGHRRNMFDAKRTQVGIGMVTVNGYTFCAIVLANEAPKTHYTITCL